MTLDRMLKGNLTLESKVSEIRKQIRQAISNSFNTADVLRFFGENDAAQLQIQLIKLEEDMKLGRVTDDEVTKEKVY